MGPVDSNILSIVFACNSRKIPLFFQTKKGECDKPRHCGPTFEAPLKGVAEDEGRSPPSRG